MKALTLGAHERLHLESLLGAQRGNAKDMYLIVGIIGAIRLNEEEKNVAKYRPLQRAGQEFMVWDRPACELMGSKTVQLEDEQARRLAEVLNSWTGFSPIDMEWVRPLLEAIDNPTKR